MIGAGQIRLGAVRTGLLRSASFRFVFVRQAQRVVSYLPDRWSISLSFDDRRRMLRGSVWPLDAPGRFRVCPTSFDRE
jgi:hypothetical protein